MVIIYLFLILIACLIVCSIFSYLIKQNDLLFPNNFNEMQYLAMTECVCNKGVCSLMSV